MFGLIRDLIRPYRAALSVVLVAMLVQTAAALAAPWPLKVILDSVVSHRPLPKWLAHLIEPLMLNQPQMRLATVAALDCRSSRFPVSTPGRGRSMRRP